MRPVMSGSFTREPLFYKCSRLLYQIVLYHRAIVANSFIDGVAGVLYTQISKKHKRNTMNPNETPEQPTPATNEQPQSSPAETPAPTTDPAPATPEQPSTPDTTPAPTSAPAATPFQPAPASQGSKAMAIWSLVLAIIAFLTGLLFFISGPLAIVALILGIVVLAKKRAGKGLAIAGIIISGFTLLTLPFTMAITFTAYNGIQEKAQQSAQEAREREQAE